MDINPITDTVQLILGPQQ